MKAAILAGPAKGQTATEYVRELGVSKSRYYDTLKQAEKDGYVRTPLRKGVKDAPLSPELTAKIIAGPAKGQSHKSHQRELHVSSTTYYAARRGAKAQTPPATTEPPAAP